MKLLINLEMTFNQGMLVSNSGSSGSGISNLAISSAIGSLFSSTTFGESSGAGEIPPPSASLSVDISEATLEIFRLFAEVEVEDVAESARFNAANNKTNDLLTGRNVFLHVKERRTFQMCLNVIYFVLFCILMIK